MRGWRVAYLAMAMLLMMTAGCKRIPLYERSTKVNLVVDLELGLGHDIVLSYETFLSEEYQKKIDDAKRSYDWNLDYHTKGLAEANKTISKLLHKTA